MLRYLLTALLLFNLLWYCHKGSTTERSMALISSNTLFQNVPTDSTASNLIDRFKPPEGFIIMQPDSNSFAFFLQHLPLKKHGSPVYYFDRTIKSNTDIYCGVVDFPLGNRDLQQCADAVIRLRAEYLYKEKRFTAIHFNFISDGKPRYYTDYAKEDYSYITFCGYLDYIYSYANTRSLYNEMKPVNHIKEIEIGDVLIQKGNPYGHAVIVVNKADDSQSGTVLYMLAQSYMPAQDIQILVNPGNPEISPWYKVREGAIVTPEWVFNTSDLRRFTD